MSRAQPSWGQTCTSWGDTTVSGSIQLLSGSRVAAQRILAAAPVQQKTACASKYHGPAAARSSAQAVVCIVKVCSAAVEAPCPRQCPVALRPQCDQYRLSVSFHAGGRYLADIWMYNLNKLAWTAPSSPAEAEAAQPSGQENSPLLSVSGAPPAAGWSVTPLQDNKLLVMGGHTKVGKVCLRHSRSCAILMQPCAPCNSIGTL
jgi:hypothetical protein